MENQSRSVAARQALQDLASDRDALAQRLIAPRWLYPLIALVTAAYVATPAIQPGNTHSVVVGCLAAAFVLLVSSYSRLSGVRVGRVGFQGGAILTGLVVAVLVLLSSANGLAASLSAWWVLAPAAAAFVVVLFGGRHFDRACQENLRRGR